MVEATFAETMFLRLDSLHNATHLAANSQVSEHFIVPYLLRKSSAAIAAAKQQQTRNMCFRASIFVQAMLCMISGLLLLIFAASSFLWHHCVPSCTSTP
jgi:hypothetical protein